MTSISNCASRIAIIALASAGLAACANGGGGGGGGGVAAVPAAAPATTGGKALTVFVPEGSLTMASATARKVTVTENGNSAIATAAGLPASGTLARDTRIQASASDQFYSDFDSALAIARKAGNDVLSDASYGMIVQSGLSGGVHYGGFHHGSQTPTSEMPSTAGATYTGSFGGIALVRGSDESSGGIVALEGDTTITANFGAGTVSGNVSNVVSDDGAGRIETVPIRLSMKGQISGNTYTGSAAITDTNGNAIGPTSSAHNGGFYGPNAAEIAGSVIVSSSFAEGGDGERADITVTGAYGAKR